MILKFILWIRKYILKIDDRSQLEIAIDNGLRMGKNVHIQEGVILDPGHCCVFCKPFLHKIAKSFCRLLHLHFVGNCKTTAGSYSASHKPLQIIFSCYNTRYGNGSSEFSSSCACSLK